MILEKEKDFKMRITMSKQKIIIENEDHTLGAILRKEILKQDSTDFAAYKKEHPLKRNVELTVVSDNPDKSVEDAKKSLQKQVKKLQKGWESELQKVSDR
jgi:DNA-directed RNA polymerase II subunit RPB11